MLSGLPVLIVEDEPVIAMLVADDVEALEGAVVGPFATVSEALAAMEHAPVAAAVLDANLADRDVTPLAERLLEKHIPFVIYSGTGVPEALAARRPGLPFVMKPGRPVEVLMAILQAGSH